jgi:ribosomal RNA-processing protein 36
VRQHYGFVYEQAEEEARRMRGALKAHRAAEAKPTSAQRRKARRAGKLLDSDHALELQKQADRRTSLLGAKKRDDRERQAKAELKAKELAAVAQGKRPYFPKRGVIKDATLTKQYHELKAKGKLGTALAERRKRRAGKQRKWMPTGRQARDGGDAES